jgi:hypothetical protein
VQDKDEEFYKRADAHIHLANDQVTKDIIHGKVSASFLFGAARFNAYISATGCESKEEMISNKEEAIKYFVNEYRKMIEENYDDYIENYEKYMGPPEKT